MSQISHTCLPSKITIPSDVAICVPMKQTRGTNTCFLQRAHSLRRFSGCRTESGSRLQHRLVTRAQGYSGTDQPHVQLATAKLPKSLNVKQFQSELFQWANSITCTSGKQMPFSLPLRLTPQENGFEISMLRSHDGRFLSEGNIVTSIEEDANVGHVLIIRFFEGEFKLQSQKDSQQRVKNTVERLIDVPTIMKLFPVAIKEISRRNMQQ